MTDLSDAAKRDIAHKFELPERRSKIASLIKQNEQLYCICRSTDSTRFMIACDSCDEWYHADCINLTKSEATAIKCYYCPLCVTSNPKLKTIYKRPGGSSSKSAPATGNHQRKRGVNQAATSAPRPPVKKSLVEKKQHSKCFCEGCNRTRNCGKCSGCTRHAKCVERRCTGKKVTTLSDEDYNSSNFSDSESDQEPEPIWIVEKPKSKAPPPKAKEVKKKPVRKPAATKGGAAKRQVRPNARRKPVTAIEKPEKESSSDEETVDFGKGPRQCYGPGCVELASPNSKYCRDYCGIALAHARIYAILPVRLTEWSMTATVAEQHNQEELDEVRQKYYEAGEEIKVLLRKRSELEKHLARVSEKELDSDSSDEEHDDDGMVYCVTCGHEISMKTCLKHMEKCFNKYEGKTTFGSVFKQGVIEGPPIFCDFYNGANKTYCKRLAVLCAEHVKQPKTGDKEYCGYPVDELTNKENPFGKFCRVRKKKCNTHFSWEKLRRASIDMQRVRMYSRMDELLDKDVKLRTAQRNRGALMSLLLNSTFNHDVMNEKVKKKQIQDEAKELKLSEDEEAEESDGNESSSSSSSSASSSSSGTL